jgi:hypothetical protein
MTDIRRLNPETRYSDAVIHGGTVYLAGQVGETLTGSVTVQTQEVLATIDRLLAEAGTDKARLLTATVYLTHMSSGDCGVVNLGEKCASFPWLRCGNSGISTQNPALLSATGCAGLKPAKRLTSQPCAVLNHADYDRDKWKRR